MDGNELHLPEHSRHETFISYVIFKNPVHYRKLPAISYCDVIFDLSGMAPGGNKKAVSCSNGFEHVPVF